MEIFKQEGEPPSLQLFWNCVVLRIIYGIKCENQTQELVGDGGGKGMNLRNIGVGGCVGGREGTERFAVIGSEYQKRARQGRSRLG